MADTIAVSVRRNAYVDSVTLLQVSADVLSVPGVLDAALVMATELNRQVLDDAGLLVERAAAAGPNDLVIAVRAADAALADAAVERATASLAGRRGASVSSDGAARVEPRSLRSAHRAAPEANLALISVPGRFAAAEARQALADGLHVFLFSDNVELQDEVELKQAARSQGLLVMGPDCGTAILRGVGLGFANVVRRGRVGLVAASGTGLQEVTSLLHQAGEGISHAIGTGGRDLQAPVGGLTTLSALELLRDDPDTEVIVLISKPPEQEVAERVLAAAAQTGKPIVACLLNSRAAAPPGVQMTSTLYEAVRLAAPSAGWAGLTPADLPRRRVHQGQNQVLGLFCGGTLCEEAEAAIHGPRQLIDFGDDRYTRGRAHPMIDPALRNHAIVEAGANARVAVLLLDVILGLGSHPDPAGAALPALREAMASADADGRELTVIAHVVGTDRDPQGLARQEAALRSAGVYVFGSNYEAAVAASLLVEGVVA